MKVVEKDLDSISIYLAGLITGNQRLDGMDDPGDPNFRELSKNNVYATITNDITQYPSIDAILSTPQITGPISPHAATITILMRKNKQSRITLSPRFPTKITSGGSFFSTSINGKYYLLKIFRGATACTSGLGSRRTACFPRLMKPMQAIGASPCSPRSLASL